MCIFDDVRRLALGLPGVAEKKNAFTVGGKSFAAVYPERVHPTRPRVPNFGVIVLWVEDLGTKEAYLAGEPELFFTTDHYDGYACVLLRLDAVDEQRLASLLTEAWQVRRP